MILEDSFVGRLLGHMYVPQHQAGGRKLGSRTFGEPHGVDQDDESNDEAPGLGSKWHDFRPNSMDD